MKFLLTLLLLLSSLSAFACFRAKGEWRMNDASLRVDQRIEVGKTYSFAMDTYLMNLTYEKLDTLSMKVFQKSKNSLMLVSHEIIKFTDTKTAKIQSFDEKMKLTTSFEIQINKI